MSADKQFNISKDPAAARLVAENKQAKENPRKSRVSKKKAYDGEKG